MLMEEKINIKKEITVRIWEDGKVKEIVLYSNIKKPLLERILTKIFKCYQ
jgi:hypothetical protein